MRRASSVFCWRPARASARRNRHRAVGRRDSACAGRSRLAPVAQPRSRMRCGSMRTQSSRSSMRRSISRARKADWSYPAAARAKLRRTWRTSTKRACRRVRRSGAPQIGRRPSFCEQRLVAIDIRIAGRQQLSPNRTSNWHRRGSRAPASRRSSPRGRRRDARTRSAS